MDTLYIALLVHKRKIEEGRYVCEGICPIVGLLMGRHFLSSHSRHYIPMITKSIAFEEDQFYLEDYDYSKDEFFQTDVEYGYYELKKVDDYSLLSTMIEEYKKKYEKVCYFLDFARMTPTIIRYKRI